jgi:DNA gyrase subunit A
MIFLAVHNGQPKELPLDKAIHAFIDHRIDVVRRRTAFLLNKARDREHVLLGYQIALDHLDTVIKIIRQSPPAPTPAKTSSLLLQQAHHLAAPSSPASPSTPPSTASTSPAAASPPSSPTTLPARSSSATARSTPSSNCSSTASPSSPSTSSSTSSRRPRQHRRVRVHPRLREAKLRRVIVKELEDIRDKYGDARRTVILDESTELTLEDLIADEQVAVTVSNTGYLKRTPISIYRQQRAAAPAASA